MTSSATTDILVGNLANSEQLVDEKNRQNFIKPKVEPKKDIIEKVDEVINNELPIPMDIPNVPNNGMSEDEMLKKNDLLRKLGELRQKGITISENYNMNSDIKKMENEYLLLKSIRDKQNGVQLMTNGLLTIIKMLEYASENYDPFGYKIRLTGWRDCVVTDINNYYEVLGEIYDKYQKPNQKLPPELKLIMMLIASATTLYLNQMMIKILPGGGDMLNKLRQMASGDKNPKEMKPQSTPQPKPLSPVHTFDASIDTSNLKANLMLSSNNSHDDTKSTKSVKSSVSVKSAKSTKSTYSINKNAIDNLSKDNLSKTTVSKTTFVNDNFGDIDVEHITFGNIKPKPKPKPKSKAKK